MSLSLENVENSTPIAGVYKNSKKIQTIYYINDNYLSEDAQKLTKIKLNEPNQMFFPEIIDFKKSNQTQRTYITGPTGCGKSTYIRNYIIAFKNKYKKAKVLLFSSKKKDELLDDLEIERVEIDNDILVNPYTLEQIAGLSKPSLTIFDDVQDFENKKINQEIARLRDEILRNGRSYGIYCLFVNHDPCAYRETKSQLFEASQVVIFPKRVGSGTYNYLLEKKLHLPKNYIDIILKAKSNFVVINKSLPQFILSDKYILLQ